MPVRETSICILAINVGMGTGNHVRDKSACKEYNRLGNVFFLASTY